jgi:anhydro-N-acetylmuramic acid kinase
MIFPIPNPQSLIPLPATIIGLMSGTSADGVDAALLTTDGRTVAEAGASLFVPYSNELRAQILGLMKGEGDETQIAHSLTQVHIQAVNQLIKLANVSRETISLIGFHGQTIKHQPEIGLTQQIGDAELMARTLGIPVVADFRSNDVAHGGQGAPLVPLYHAALAEKQALPLLVVNIGGVANVTWIGEASTSHALHRPSPLAGEARWGGVDEEYERSPLLQPPPARGGGSLEALPSLDFEILAFDCGPGNALLDDWVHQHIGTRYDENGELAAKGKVHEDIVAALMAKKFFARAVPKSLDRNEFAQALDAVAHLSPADGAATLTAFTAQAIAAALDHVPHRPELMIICGGGRHNPTLMRMVSDRVNLPPNGGGTSVLPVEALGWNGDMLEAQAFAYLAARSVQGLPLSLPSTTGVREAVSGGALFMPVHHHHDDEDDDCTAPRSCCR